MIDRIRFYIEKVKYDYIKSRLDLAPIGVDKYENYIYGTKIRNLEIVYSGERLMIYGSLHKYAKGNNYCLFTYEEAKNALRELSEHIGISLESFVVTKIELGINIQMREEPKKYLDIIRSYEKEKFYYKSPLSDTNKREGIHCHFTKYDIKFYNKTFQYIHEEKIPVRDRHIVPPNILRYEISLTRNKLKYEGFKNVTGKNLLSSLHYNRFKGLMRGIFNEIIIDDTSMDYSSLLPIDVKKYIFAVSDGHSRYLQYLKDYLGEKEFRKEIRRTKTLLKKVAPLKIGKLESELKSKFLIAMSEI